MRYDVFVILFYVIYAASKVNCDVTEAPRPVISVDSGPIRGYVDSSANGNAFYSFRGIPYAKPPVKSLRFKPPEPVEAWSDVLDCTADGHQCPQMIRFGNFNGYHGNEDCLTLNVYTPQIENDADRLLPVFIVIHGGGFLVGSGSYMVYGPHLLMDESPIVMVTFNYRLGILGFLSTEDEHAVGNYAMLDQVLVLQWVQRNIRSFGGDPSRVTLYGISAGAASVSHHLLSPLSKGLFHRAILASGSSMNHWSVNKNPLQWARGFAQHLNCSNSHESRHIVSCLSELEAERLVSESVIRKLAPLFPIDLAPTIDPPGGPGFLNDHPTTLLQEQNIVNKVPVILGLVDKEGYSLIQDLLKLIKFKGREYFDKQFPEHLSTFAPVLPNMTLARRAIAREYYDHVDNLDDEDVNQRILFEILGDAVISAGVAKTAELLAEAGVPTYAYMFDHLNQHCIAGLMGGKCGKYRSHGDDLLLTFKMFNMGPTTVEDKKVSHLMTGLWTSFAYGRDLYVDGDEKWPLYDTKSRHYLNLNFEQRVKQGLLSDKMEFWMETIPSLLHKVDSKDEL